MANETYQTIRYTDNNNPDIHFDFYVSDAFGEDTATIIDALREILKTETGSQLINKTRYGNTNFYFDLHPESSGYSKPEDRIYLAATLFQAPDYFINEKGILEDFSLIRVLAHELSHQVLSTRDPNEIYNIDFSHPNTAYETFNANANADTLGEAVTFENQLIKEMYGEAASVRTQYFDTTGYYRTDLFKALDIESISSYVTNGPIESTKTGYDSNLSPVELIRSDSFDDLNDLLIGVGGVDHLISGGGDDYLFGGDDDDLLLAGNDQDVLVGGRGNDFLLGGNGQDFLEGGAGNDVLIGSGVDNLEEFGRFLQGDPILSYGYDYYDDLSRDVLDGGVGVDLYQFQQLERHRNVVYSWLAGSQSYAECDSVIGWEPTEFGIDFRFIKDLEVSVFDNLDVIRDIDGYGTILGVTSTLYSSETPEVAEYLTRFSGSSFVVVDSGNPSVFIENSDPNVTQLNGLPYLGGNLVYLHDNNLYFYTYGRSLSAPGEIDDNRVGYFARFVIEDFVNGDFDIYLDNGKDEAIGPNHGSNNNDTVQLTPRENGKGALFGAEAGDDTVIGTYDGDKIRAGAGNDHIDAGAGDDTVFGEDGSDQIFGGSGEDFLNGGNGEDTVFGGLGNDQLIGGSGSDTYFDVGGSDTYLYNLGDGNDQIFDSGTAEEQDSLILTGVTIDDIVLSRTGSNLTSLKVRIVSTDEVIIVSNQFALSGIDEVKHGIEKLVLRSADDEQEVIYTAAELSAMATSEVPANIGPVAKTPTPNQTVLEDNVWTFAVSESAFADADGDTLIYSAALADGSALPAWLNFDAGTRTFQGTPPQDFNGMLSLKVVASDGMASVEEVFELVINPVNDVPVVASLIADQSIPEGTAWGFTVPADTFNDADGDVLSFSATLSDGSPLPSWLSFDASTKTFSGTPPQNTAGTLSLKVIAFDGTTSVADEFSLVIEPADLTPVTLTGTSGDDDFTYNLGDGNVAIVEGANMGGGDRLLLGAGITVASVTVSRSGSDGNNAMLHFADGGQVELIGQFAEGWLRGIEQVVFEDGTIWDTHSLANLIFDQLATEGDDQISGFADGSGTMKGLGGNDTLEGTAATERIEGGAGNDIINGNGGGDSLFGNDGDDQISGGDGVQFIDGGAGHDVIDGGNGNDIIWSRDGDDEISVGFGDDFVNAGAGNDTIIFKAGETGHNTIGGFAAGAGSDDVLQFDVSVFADFAAALAAASDDGTNTTITVDANTSVTLENVLVSQLHADDFQLVSQDATTTLTGTSGDDDFTYNLGDGNVAIVEGANMGGGDRLLLGAGITVASVTVSRSGSDGNNAMLHFADGGQVELIGQFAEGWLRGIEQVVFEDGTIWDTHSLANLIFDQLATEGDDQISGFADGSGTMKGLGGNDTLEGTAATERIEGGAGNDIINGNGGGDSLFGNDGDDQISGGDGVQFIDGGAGHDVIDGGNGNDIIWSRDGDDEISVGFGDDFVNAGAGNDTIIFKAGETGHNTIGGFAAGAGSDDVLQFDVSVFADFAAALAAASDDGTNTTITVDANTSVTLENVLVSQLHQDDFQFV
ncbi:putative Ig domain-containing protein [Roseibium aggregatum]|uniref:Leukotoxin n=1 Tax=Roseibium aggregatum TaxID=187304 RepID=A0A0M6YDJ4_9HYPH|nr:putative Ig domain-containing protein [Roseibium aggregatum]CTQ47573.1 Leukotoxin [Roseibium aggregatum]